MPYIKQEDRPKFDEHIEALNREVACAGDFNYVVSRLGLALIAKLGGRYDHHNTVIGAMECAKLELYRRRTGPYEDGAIAKNGDI